MEIKTLSGTTKEEIFEAFKKAFENYVIPLDFDEESTYRRWDVSEVNYDLSYGVYESSQLVAFILHTTYGINLFNFATGVIPSHRGKHLIEQISNEVSRNVKGFKIYSLEVIKENLKAIQLYKKLGFLIEREMISMKGKLIIGELLDKNFDYQIKTVSYNDEQMTIQMSRPSMENSSACLMNNPTLHELHELRDNGELLAYAIYTPMTMSLREMGAIDIKFLDQLFLQMKINEQNLRIMNIDSSSQTLLHYFEERGINRFVTQYAMSKAF